MEGSASTALLRLTNCVQSVAQWFMLNDLLVNASKSDALVVGTRQQVKSFNDKDVLVAGQHVKLATEFKFLGVVFDPALTLDNHISNVCSSTYYHVKALKHIRKFIDQRTANTIACSLIVSKIDYC